MAVQSTNTDCSNEMRTILVGVGDFKASRTPCTIIKTMALGSCVAVVLLEPKTRCIGMVHVALPDSSINQQRSKDTPGYFADTGISALVQEMEDIGCDANRRGWIVKMAGGANVADANHVFNVGKRNIIAVKKALWNLRMAPRSEDIGKNFSRTVSVDIRTGVITISCPGRGTWRL